MKQEMFKYLEKCLNEETLPHAFLIKTNNIDNASEQIIKFLFDKNIIKQKTAINNLNLIEIRPEGKEIKTAEIDNLKVRFATLPSNDKYNVYIINGAEKMNASAANKLLKFLEEPTDFILGFLIINEEGVVLDTIKSRCQEFKLSYKSEISELQEQIGGVLDYLDNPEYKKEQSLRESFSSLDRQEIITVIEKSLIILGEKLTKGEEVNIISTNILLLDNVLRLVKSNVNIDLALDKLFIEAR